VLYAAPEFSLEPITWRYPLVGKLGYRGYFSEHEATTSARGLRQQGHDVFIGGVDAYSTLGWFHDPVLNTFIDYPELDLAETLFHELTHHRVFRPGDTSFNEALACVVAEEGVQLWLAGQGRDRELHHYRQRLVRRGEFQREIERARARLATLYASGSPPDRMRRDKAAIMADLSGQFRELHRRWGGRGLEGWLTGTLNNGHLASVTLYTDRMPEIRRLLAECGGDFSRFFRRCESAGPESAP
jgi:predicted aminopeptidase